MFTRFLLGLVLSSVMFSVQADPQQARILVENVSTQMLQVLEDNRAELDADPKKIYGYVDDLLLKHFDFESMARLALGKHWRRAKADEREAFVKEFRSLLIRTYGTALLTYNNQKMVYLPLRARETDKRVAVKTEIHPDGGFPIPVDYKLYTKNDQPWKVYDVVIDRVSLVTSYRSSFNSQVRRHGIQGLINMLVDQNAKAGQ